MNVYESIKNIRAKCDNYIDTWEATTSWKLPDTELQMTIPMKTDL